MVAQDPVSERVGADLEQDLAEAGLEDAQARALRRAVERTVDGILARFATREEVHALGHELRAEMKELRNELRTEMTGMENQLRAEMQGMEERLRAEMQGMEERLRAEMQSMEERLREEIRSAIAHSTDRIDFQLKVSWLVFLLIGGGLMGMMAAILARL